MATLRYPLTIYTEETDYLQIDVQKYVPVGNKQGGAKETDLTTTNHEGQEVKDKANITEENFVRNPNDFFRKNTYTKSLNTILLPIPSDIRDSNTVSYNEDKMNNITAAGVGGVTEIIKNFGKTGFDGSRQAAENALKTAGMSSAEAQNLSAKWFAGKAVGVFGANVTVDQLLARSGGQVFNPNMELLFSGPTLRNFNFSFKMTPRNKEESIQVKQIIRTFKRSMAPKAGANKKGAFLESPDIFELTYRQGGGKHKFLNSFKQCFLTNIGVNYTGEGTYATYGDGTPISMIMSLSFKELAPIYDVDYDEDHTGPLADAQQAFMERGTGLPSRFTGGVGY